MTNKVKRKPITITIKEDLLKELNKYCEENGYKKNRLIEKLIENQLSLEHIRSINNKEPSSEIVRNIAKEVEKAYINGNLKDLQDALRIIKEKHDLLLKQ